MSMLSRQDVNDEDSFIILGTSPGSSLDIKCNGINGDEPLDKSQIEDAMKDMSLEANMAFKAHFKLGDCPSPASMMVASTLVSDDKSTEELQKRFGEILDENIILKDTLKQNNDSMRDQFLLIASCQEDMMKTHLMHKEKFDETRELVEKLRNENKKLKQDIVKLADSSDSLRVNTETGEVAGPSSAVEFVSSPDDDTVNKLTAQLELVEKQRRQVIVENEKLTWQKESLEHIIDATSKERDQLKEKLKHVELKLSSKENEFTTEINKLKVTIQDLNNQLHSSHSLSNTSTEELKKRDALIHQLDTKVATLQSDFKNAQLKILELENIKLEFSKHKSGVLESAKIYKEQIQELNNRLKEAQTTMFQPVRVSLSAEAESSTSEYAMYLSNVKLYDRTLKHLAELLNSLINGTTDSLAESQGLIASLQDFKLDKTSADRFRSSLVEVKQLLEKHHSSAFTNICNVRGTISILEGIFKDYNEILKKTVAKQDNNQSNNRNVEALTAALLARGQELLSLEGEVKKLKGEKEERDVLKAQLELYKGDFEAERAAREKMASAKETVMTDLRTTQRRNQELLQQLDELRKSSPSKRLHQQSPSAPPRSSSGPASNVSTATTGNVVRKKKKVSESNKAAEENMDVHESTPPPLRFDCPVCDKPFKTLMLLQQHVDSCLL